MLLSAVLVLDAALARFIGAYTSWTLDSSSVRDLLMLACIVVDTWHYRRLHPAFVGAGLLVFVSDYAAIWMAHTATWNRFAEWVISA